MIGDNRPISVTVKADAGTAVSGEVVSIGLIVTELVINALKHAFPGGGDGKILVSYDIDGAGWRLSVADDGVGLPNEDGGDRHTGLGTSIVEALAHLQSALEAANQKLTSDQAKLDVMNGGPTDEDVRQAQGVVAQAQQAMAKAVRPGGDTDLAQQLQAALGDDTARSVAEALAELVGRTGRLQLGTASTAVAELARRGYLDLAKLRAAMAGTAAANTL